ncbi:DeoR/GlpR family DNA-binding transcription regulator [Anaerococcus sp.]|uniref:DeoR/GlpR family DNA-binding transcription regulator n=1 Tax=Anaerococcus TaxID=165779 RepID=UPI0029035BAD|nr:DeoR/GlpR family DNA-binding transcription regulator [Anaerococcus sp.]MDU1828964.1 DeoR/GlpR family DNA-binding transcription regulator [Anaerococcus sp.]MDU1864077.1 DeoR/GlpR family DNA-binding transcription regulator [Anaerococcus sp.]
MKYILFMIVEERLNLIREMLKKEEIVSNSRLLEKLDVSESTLRRDLDYLQGKGEIRRVRGGATLNKLLEETNFKFNETANIESKRIIGEKASKLIEDGSHIFLDAGTTIYSLIEYLENKNVTVVTNGLMHLEKLNNLSISTVVLGGNIKESTFITYGEQTINEINNLNFDLAFIGANGICDNIYSTADINEALIKKAAINKSNRSYVLADSSKFGKKYFADICTFDDAKLIKEDE